MAGLSLSSNPNNRYLDDLAKEIDQYYSLSREALSSLSDNANTIGGFAETWDQIGAQYKDVADQYSTYVDDSIAALQPMMEKIFSPGAYENLPDLYEADVQESAAKTYRRYMEQNPRAARNQGAQRELVMDTMGLRAGARQRGSLDAINLDRQGIKDLQDMEAKNAALIASKADTIGLQERIIAGKKADQLDIAKLRTTQAEGFRGLGQDGLSVLGSAMAGGRGTSGGVGGTSQAARELSLSNAAMGQQARANAATGLSAVPLSKAYQGPDIYTDPTYRASLVASQSQGGSGAAGVVGGTTNQDFDPKRALGLS